MIRRLSLFHLITLSTVLAGQTLGVKDITAVGMSQDQATAVSNRVKGEALKHTQTVDRGAGFQEVLLEHGLRQAGATNTDDTLSMETANQILSGTAGQSATDHWFIDLALTNVNSGMVMASKHATVSNYADLLTISKTVARALLQGTELQDDPAVSITPDSSPIIIGTSKVIVEQHIYEHKAGTHGNKRFIPCSYCQGRGKVPCTDRDGRPCPGRAGTMDCPYCNINSAYKGSQTHGMFLTGRWED